MALVVETGEGIANAESYASVEYADAYHLVRLNTQWGTLTPEAKEAALREATDYIEMRFADVFRGAPATESQALSFPRNYTGFPTTMPAPLLKATAEYALRAVGPEGLAPDLKLDETGRLATKIVKKMGPMDKEFTYPTRGELAKGSSFRSYPLPDGFISQLTMQSGIYR
jgi:hypothetical protein